MKNNDDIHSTDTNEIKHLINCVKQGELDQGDALLIEKLLSILLTIVSLLERKHTSIRRMKELLFGMKEKKRGKDEDKNRAEDGRPGADGSSQTDSPNEMNSNSTCEGVRRLKRPGHGRMAASDYPGARLVRLIHPEMAPGDPCPESGCDWPVAVCTRDSECVSRLLQGHSLSWQSRPAHERLEIRHGHDQRRVGRASDAGSTRMNAHYRDRQIDKPPQLKHNGYCGSPFLRQTFGDQHPAHLAKSHATSPRMTIDAYASRTA
jgi:hypothetical protein